MNPLLLAITRLSLPLGLALFAVSAQAARPTLCVWDPVGRGGQLFSLARSYTWALEAKEFKVNLRAYTDEGVAVEDFKVGQCDGLLATTLRTKTWLGPSAALDYIGATTILKDGKVDAEASNEVARRAVRALALPMSAGLNMQGPYESVGIIPAGATYMLVRDREIFKRGLAGVRMPVFDNDRLQLALVARTGGVPVSVSTRSFGTMFNNGMLDVVFAPAVAYETLELHKGVGTRGGVSRYPLAFTTLQVLIKRDRFPAGFGAFSRQYWSDQFRLLMTGAQRAEAAIPPEKWVDYEGEAALQFLSLQRDARVEAGKAGHYNKLGLRLMKRVRCGVHPTASDCGTPAEIDW